LVRSIKAASAALLKCLLGLRCPPHDVINLLNTNITKIHKSLYTDGESNQVNDLLKQERQERKAINLIDVSMCESKWCF